MVVGIGNLICDMYYQDNKVIGINGGKTFANIIFNLANMGIKTKIIGNCGNDDYGEIALNSLKRVGVDLSEIKILSSKTPIFYISKNKQKMVTSTKCPICHTNTRYNKAISNIKIEKEDIVIIDSLKYLTSITEGKVMLDIGYFNQLRWMTDDELISFINYKFEIINMNNVVFKYLIKRLKIKENDIYNKFNTKLLIITKGSDGADYYFNNCHIHLDLIEKSDEIDPNGAGDIFFASTIKDYINNYFVCDEKFINNSFKNANKLTKEVVKLFGARTYYQDFYYMKKICNNKKDL